jgi:hypothetical protein
MGRISGRLQRRPRSAIHNKHLVRGLINTYQWELRSVANYLNDDQVSFKSAHIKAKPNAKVEKAIIEPYGLNSYQNMGIMIKEFHNWFDVHEFVFFSAVSRDVQSLQTGLTILDYRQDHGVLLI